MVQRRRMAAHGVLRDDGGRVLLVRGAAECPYPGVWQLPGGRLWHAEHPAAAAVRGFGEATGLAVTATDIRAAVADLVTLDAGVAVHTDRMVFDVTAGTGGAFRPESGGDSDELGWFTPGSVTAVPVMPFTAELLGLSGAPLPLEVPGVLPAAWTVPVPADRRHRFGAYGLVTDPAGRVLLTLIADGYPGAGSWHLPGGGTDHGEAPEAGLLRELVEESAQVGRVVELIGVDSLHVPRAMGPEGRPLDWYTVRVIYTVAVDEPTEAVVTELAGGSTAQASWFTVADLAGLRLSDVAGRMITEWIG
ncbi:NUDIX hydrolase [Salinispora arenicola]|uniref:NUDIX hydrolase n=1 Tax=Salinispora arenicola TaxID=168697 RepID=UPI0003673473|nr:NUDIX domain-containing protein [Salinispora arenicola]